MGIFLLDVCMFDLRDTFIYESQLEKLKNGGFTGGTGPTQKAAMDKKKDHILEAADRFGENIVHFVAKVVGLISNLAIITKRIYYIWIY